MSGRAILRPNEIQHALRFAFINGTNAAPLAINYPGPAPSSPCVTCCFAQLVFHHSSPRRRRRRNSVFRLVPSSPSSLTLTSRRFSTESQLCTGGNNIYLVESPPEYCGPDTYHLSRVTSLGCVALRRQLKLDFNSCRCRLASLRNVLHDVLGYRAENNLGNEDLIRYIPERGNVSPAGRSTRDADRFFGEIFAERKDDVTLASACQPVPHKLVINSVNSPLRLTGTSVRRIGACLQNVETPIFQLSLIILLRLQRFLEAYKYTCDPFSLATYPSRKEG